MKKQFAYCHDCFKKKKVDDLKYVKSEVRIMYSSEREEDGYYYHRICNSCLNSWPSLTIITEEEYVVRQVMGT